MQTLVSRETSPLDSSVISITKLAAGEGANNVIPDFATFGGTLRGLGKQQLLSMKRRIEEVSTDTLFAFGVRPTPTTQPF